MPRRDGIQSALYREPTVASMMLHTMEGERMRRVADSLLEYFERNPHASDTLDGIQWWAAHDESLSREDLPCALAMLVAEGHLEKHEAAHVADLARRV